ncbi:MAG: nucleotide-binding universal stress UspA family protein, partial [Rhodothermales bacterium]
MKRLLVAIDFGDTTNSVLARGRSLSEQLGCELLLCHAVEYVPKGYETDLSEEREIRKHFDDRLQELTEGLNARALPATIGPAVDVMLRLAKAHKVDAILAGVSNR